MRLHHRIAAATLLGAVTFSPMLGGLALAQSSTEVATPLSPADRKAAVSQFATLLQARYVDPDVAARYAAALEQAARRGDYDSLADPNAFAARLTADLRAVSLDKHLRLSVGEIPARGRGSRAPRSLPDIEARWAAPGIAYLAVNASPGDPAVAAEAERLLLAHTGARAIILDLRQNSGGAAAIMNRLFPYLFGKPTPLVLMDTRAAVEAELGAPDEEPSVRPVASPAGVVRREHVAVPHATERRFFDVPVYVLTSGRTASVAEHMTLALKRTGRATIVGETTSGAGHYGHFTKVGSRFVAFVPFGRTFDPDTGRGWEATGIAPDVTVPADRALETALGLAGARSETAATTGVPTAAR